jgi:hypothetical protein
MNREMWFAILILFFGVQININFCKKYKICYISINDNIHTCIHNEWYVWRLNQTVLELDFRTVKFCSSLDGIWTHTIDTLQHHSLSLTSSVLDNFIWIEPLFRGHLHYKVPFSLSPRWPLNTGLTIYIGLIFRRIYIWVDLDEWSRTWRTNENVCNKLNS